MTGSLFSQEHYDLMAQFEQQFKGDRLDREDKSHWPRGIVYQDGNVNARFLAFRRGVAYGTAVERSNVGAPVPAQAAPSMEAKPEKVEWHRGGKQAVLRTYLKLHERKLGAHWLWCAIEQIAAGQSEASVLADFGYVPTTAAPAGVPSDSQLIDMLREESMDLRCFIMPIPMSNDADIGWRVVDFYMAEPKERTVAEVSHDDPREALRKAYAVFQFRRAADGPRASSPSGASQEALTADAKDAARWRQWRIGKALEVSVPNPAKPGKSITVIYGPNPEPGYGVALDAAIDAAMEQQHAQEQEGANHG